MQQLKVKNNATSSTKPSSASSSTAARPRPSVDEYKNIKYCAYQGYDCSQMAYENSIYCHRHIMEDKNAGYKQCSYMYSNKRCHLPGMKPEKRDNGYCSDHTLKMHLNKVKAASRHQPALTPETLLSSISHYVKPSRKRNSSSTSGMPIPDESTSGGDDQPTSSKITKCLDPFVEIDAYTMNASASDILEYASDSESDVEAATYATVWHDAQVDSSDNESIDSEQEDPLKHANVYTAEEVTAVTKEKLKRLQTLYIEQFRHLQYILREKRRKYLQSLRREKEQFCNIHSQPRDTPKELRLYNKLKALNQYQRKLGVDAIMHKKRQELRAKITEGFNVKPPSITRCAFVEGGVKCGERSLPVARHCRKHILEDPNQVLFRACGKQKADMQCSTPVEMIFPDATCRLHMDIPVIRNYSQTRRDSESDYEESGDIQNPEDDSTVNTMSTSIKQTPYKEESYVTQSPECSDWSFQPEQFSADESTMDYDRIMHPTNDSIQSYVDDLKHETFPSHSSDASGVDPHSHHEDNHRDDEEHVNFNINDVDIAAALAASYQGYVDDPAVPSSSTHSATVSADEMMSKVVDNEAVDAAALMLNEIKSNTTTESQEDNIQQADNNAAASMHANALEIASEAMQEIVAAVGKDASTSDIITDTQENTITEAAASDNVELGNDAMMTNDEAVVGDQQENVVCDQQENVVSDQQENVVCDQQENVVGDQQENVESKSNEDVNKINNKELVGIDAEEAESLIDSR